MPGLAHLKDLQRKAVTGDMLLGNRVPAPMFDGNTGLVADRLEPDLNVRDLIRRKRCLPPAEREPLAGQPGRDAADLEGFAVWQIRHEPPAFTRLETQNAITARRELKQPVRPPPRGNLLREHIERLARRRLHAQRDDHRAHLRFCSTRALNDASWSAHIRSVSASHFFRSAMAPSFSV